MKSMTTMPPRSRSRSWRTISSAASRLFLVTVSSRLPPWPVNLPVLTSTTTIASVLSITSEPPLGSQTLRSSAFISCSSIRYVAKTSTSEVHLDSRSARSGATCDDVAVDGLPRLVTADDDLGEVLVEDVADDPDGHVRLAVEQGRRVAAAALRLLLDVLPLRLQPLDVAAQLVLARALGGGAHDDARVLGDDLLEDGLQPRALGVGQLAADAGHRALGHVDQVAAGQRDLAGQAGALVADRVLGDLHEHRLAGLQRGLDAARPVGHAERLEVDLTGVQHGVAALADVDERGLHGRQHVLDLAQVDVADVRGRLLLVDVVLDEHVVLEDADLGALAVLADDHHALDGLAAGQELGLGDDRNAAAALLAAFAGAPR